MNSRQSLHRLFSGLCLYTVNYQYYTIYILSTCERELHHEHRHEHEHDECEHENDLEATAQIKSSNFA
jgi:hypothetical protein